MLITKEEISSFPFYENELSYIASESLFFDIETTGLSADTCCVFLIGTLACSSEGTWILTSYFAEHPEEEKELLKAFFQQASAFPCLIHFNGASFDLPFLKKRAEKLSLNYPLEEKSSLDLYQKLRRLKNILDLQNTKQVTFEKAAGWKREDQLTGKHMLSLYQKYVVCHEDGLRNLLLLHNHDDMLGMTKILSLASLLSLLNGIIPDGTVYTCEYNDVQNVIHILLTNPAFAYPECESHASICDCMSSMRIQKSQISISISLKCDTLFHFFPDYKNYYYLPLEDQAIHKSVASFMDSSYRQKATPSDCYIKKAGNFLPSLCKSVQPEFRTCFSSKNHYVLLEETAFKNNLPEYTASILVFFSQHGTH